MVSPIKEREDGSMKTWQANILLLITAMIWGISFVATEEILKYLSPLHMQVYRFGIASVVASIVFYKKLKNVNKKVIIYGFIIGSVYFLGMSLQTFGLQDTTVPKNAFITVTNVIWVPIVGLVLFKIRPKAHYFIGLAIIIIGFFILLFQVDIFNLTNSLHTLADQMNITFGDFLTLLCSFAFAAHIILSGRFVKSEDPILILLFQLYISTILSFLASLFMDKPITSIPFEMITLSLPSLFVLAILSSIVSYAFQLIAQQYVPANNASVLMSLESLFATLFAVLLGSILFSSSIALASIIITFGIIMAETGFKFKGKSEVDSNETMAG